MSKSVEIFDIAGIICLILMLLGLGYFFYDLYSSSHSVKDFCISHASFNSTSSASRFKVEGDYCCEYYPGFPKNCQKIYDIYLDHKITCVNGTKYNRVWGKCE